MHIYDGDGDGDDESVWHSTPQNIYSNSFEAKKECVMMVLYARSS